MTAVSGSKFRLRMLGGLWIEVDGAVWTGLTSQRKTLALLALLANAGDRGLTREKIFGLLWSESGTEQARNALSQLLFRARRELGLEAIIGNGELRLNAEWVGSDVADFDVAIANGSLDEAVRLYHGKFLDGFYIRHAPEFERWSADESQRIDRLFVEALEKLAAAATRAGNHVVAVKWWRRRTEFEPLSARPARAYLEALITAGDRQTGIRFAATYSAFVRSEIGAEPDREMARLLERLDAGPQRVAAQPINGPARHEKESSEAPTTDEGDSAPQTLRTPRLPRFVRSRTIAAGALLLVAGFGIASFASHDRGRSNLVIVMPFANESADSTLDGLGNVLANAMTQGLAHTGMLQLVDFQMVLQTFPARDSAARLSRMEASEVARKSGASLLVRGSYRRRGDSLVIQTMVVRGDGMVIGILDPVVGATGQEDALIEALRERVTGGLMALTDPGRGKWSYTSSTLPQYSAQLAYARGLEAFVDERLDLAIESFLKAAAIDTLFAAPRLQILGSDPPDSLWSLTVASLESRRSRLSVSEQLALDAAIARRNGDLENYYRQIKRVSSIAPDEPEALLTLAYAAMITNRFAEAIRAVHRMADHGGWVNDVGPRSWRDFEAHHMLGDFQGALREWSAARRLHPDDFYICEKGAGQLGALGRPNDIIALADECDALPNAPRNQSYVLLNGGRELRLHGFEAEGRRVLSAALDRQMAIGRSKPGADNSANVYLDLDDWAHAYEGFRPRVHALGPVRPVEARFAVAAAHVGDTATANAMLGRLGVPQADSSYQVRQAAILLALGRTDDALDVLRAALPSIAPVYVIHTSTLFVALRGNPRFEALIAPRR